MSISFSLVAQEEDSPESSDQPGEVFEVFESEDGDLITIEDIKGTIGSGDEYDHAKVYFGNETQMTQLDSGLKSLKGDSHATFVFSDESKKVGSLSTLNHSLKLNCKNGKKVEFNRVADETKARKAIKIQKKKLPRAYSPMYLYKYNKGTYIYVEESRYLKPAHYLLHVGVPGKMNTFKVDSAVFGKNGDATIIDSQGRELRIPASFEKESPTWSGMYTLESVNLEKFDISTLGIANTNKKFNLSTPCDRVNEKTPSTSTTRKQNNPNSEAASE